MREKSFWRKIAGIFIDNIPIKLLAIALAIASVLDPVSGALVHNAGSVLVIVDSALLLGWRSRR